MPRSFDAIVVGTGQAGPALAARLSGAGMKVAVIERGAFGGTCVNDGCTPTKAMVASAYAARLARRAADYGVELPGAVAVDMRRVKARKDAIVARSVQGIEKWMAKVATVYRGHARFAGRDRVRVGDDELAAPRIFLNVGGRPFVPPGFERVPVLTNQSMMRLEVVPPHLLVVGGSYVGLEFAHMMRRFGSRVTVIEMAPRIVARAVEKGETQGFLKLHVEASTRRLLGAALLGTGCDEAVHSLLDAVYARTPVAEFQRRVRIHPTVSELLPTALENLEPLV